MLTKEILIIILVFIGIINGVFHIKLEYRESKRNTLVKSGNFAEHNRNKQLLSINANRGLGHQQLRDYDDAEYLANISIGYPSQYFMVYMDTGSATVWVPSTECKSDECLKHNRFDSRKSRSFKPAGTQFTIEYGDGSYAHGIFGTDDICMGTNVSTSLTIFQAFGLATEMGGFKNNPADGVLGLAFTALSQHDFFAPMETAIAQHQMEMPVFTIYLEHHGDAKDVYGGQITYGSFDEEHCGEHAGTVLLTSASYWQFWINGYVSGNSYASYGGNAISDSGSGTIGGPKAVMDKLAKSLGAEFNVNSDLYEIPCDTSVISYFEISFHDFSLTVQPENYVQKVSGNTCHLAFMPINWGGWSPPFIIGNVFIRQYCHYYDLGKQQIGFYHPK